MEISIQILTFQTSPDFTANVPRSQKCQVLGKMLLWVVSKVNKLNEKF